MKIIEFYRKNIRDSRNPAIQWIIGFCKRIYLNPIIQNRIYHADMPDEQYLLRLYKQKGMTVDFDRPRTFNDKNNWRKLFDRKPIYTQMVDKYRVKALIKERVGEQYAFPLLGHWDRPEDIDFDSLPEKFVLKPNHSGGVKICRDKNTFNRRRAISGLKTAMKTDFFIRNREWPYKDVKRCIIAEAYMGENLCDYKNYVFNGKLMYTLVWKNIPCLDKKPQAYFCGMYDRDWKRTDMELNYPSLPDIVKKPKCYDEMVRVAEAMAKDTIFVRCDCYIIDDHPYVGEMTFFPWGGFQKFKDEKWNEYLGSLEKLPIEK